MANKKRKPVDDLPKVPVRLLSFHDLQTKGIRWSRPHLDRMEKAGEFPKRVTIGPATICWVESEVDAFILDAMRRR